MRGSCWLGLALAIGGCASAPQVRVVPNVRVEAPPHDPLEQHLRAVTAKLQSEGLTRGALFERGFLPPSARAAYPVRIAANECAVFVALATSNMADLDASLFSADGTPLIEDDSTGARPTLTFCASATGPVAGYLTLHAYQGAGSFVAAQFARARRADDDLHTAVAEDGGASALGQLAQTLHERGFEDVAPRVSVSLGSAPVRMAVHVVAGECYTLAAEAGAGVSEVALRLVDAEGGELANGVGEPALAAVQYCASDTSELSLELSARRGQGMAQVARFHAAQAVIGGVRALWLGEPAPSAAAWANAKAAPSQDTGHDKGAPFLQQRVPLHQGEVFELMSKPARETCELWHAELVPGLSRATLRVESERGELLGEADSDHMRACLAICNAPGPHRVTLLGRTGFGAVLLSGHRGSASAASGQRAGLVFGPAACQSISAPSEGR